MRLLRVIAVVLLCAVAGIAQTNKGAISGTVFDSNGAAVPGATVTITNLGTGQKATVITTDSGAFSAQSLDPVSYSVMVEAKGFKKALLDHVKVDTAATATANVTLETGSVTEQVVVTAEAPLLNTESGTTTHTITTRQLQDVPLNNRSVLDLALTAPNVTGDAGSEDPGVSSDQPVPGFNLNLNGGRAGSTSILADGVNNTGVGIARAVVSFTPETVQEFTVQTSAYSAEYGNTTGGVINATTKSGTNDFSGVVLWYHRNPKFNATPFSIGTAPRPHNNLRYNQVSGTVGGPIFLPKPGEGGKAFYNGKNKSFFFFAYEPRWRKDFLTSTALVPDATQLAGNFNNLVRTAAGIVPATVATQFGLTSVGSANVYQQFVLFQGKLVPIALATGNQYCQFNDPRRILVNQVYQGVTLQTPQCNSTINATANPALNIIPPEFIDPIGVKILQFMPPAGSYFLDSGNIRNYFQQRSVVQNETRYTLRLDHNFTDRAKANFRYTVTPAVGIRSAGNDINGNTGVYSNARQFLLAFNNIITPTLVNDLRLNYTRGNFSEDYSPDFSIKNGRSFAGEIGLPHLTTGGIPLFLIARDNNYVGADIGSAASTNNFNVEQRYNISDIVYWTRGNKTWKFGVDLNDARLTATPFFAASGGRWDFRVVNTSNNRSTTAANGGNTIASVLLGVPNSVDVRPLIFDYDYRWKSVAAFAQNDWKFRPNLTLNLGLRYALQLPRAEKHNNQGAFRTDLAQSFPLTDTQRRTLASGSCNPPTTIGGLGVPCATAIPDSVPTAVTIVPFAFAGRGGRSKYLVPIDYLGFEPRFGFAWSPKMKLFGLDLEKRSVVVRGGYGISHATLTGNNRSPNPDFGGFVNIGTIAGGSAVGGTLDATQPIRLTGNPPLQGASGTLDSILGTDSNGLVFLKSLGVPGFAVKPTSASGKIPYSQNWNLTVQFEPFRNTVVEVAYVGNKSNHLFLPFINVNPRNVNLIDTMEQSGLCATCTLQDPTGSIPDPLGRTNLQGSVITITRASVFTPFLGFDPLNSYFDPSGDSIRHAGYIDVRRRVSRGLTFTANYTYAKSIDTASDASPDTRTLSTGQAREQVSLGGVLRQDRAISTFDIKNNFTATGIWDVPIGRRRQFLSHAPGVVNQILGGWTMSGVLRMPGGLPFLPFITDPNHLGGVLFNRVVRPDIVPGVPLRNPLWKRNCPVGSSAPPSGCEPYINPAAFMRPVKGTLGNAPRTLDIRSPRQEFFDFALSKDFPWPVFGKEGKRRINFRVDLINAFNHPNFRYSNTGNTPSGMGTFPTEATITAAEFNTWVAFDPTARSSVTLAQVQSLVNATRQTGANGPQTGGLPLDFFHVQLPQGFATRDPLSFDITTLQGYKLYRIRQTYDTNFGTVTGGGPNTLPRYIQFGIRLFF